MTTYTYTMPQSDVLRAYAYTGARLAMAELSGAIAIEEPLRIASRIRTPSFREAFARGVMAAYDQERVPAGLLDWRNADPAETDCYLRPIRALLGLGEIED